MGVLGFKSRYDRTQALCFANADEVGQRTGSTSPNCAICENRLSPISWGRKCSSSDIREFGAYVEKEVQNTKIHDLAQRDTKILRFW